MMIGRNPSFSHGMMIGLIELALILIKLVIGV